jgi:hypothetical protein
MRPILIAPLTLREKILSQLNTSVLRAEKLQSEFAFSLTLQNHFRTL